MQLIMMAMIVPIKDPNAALGGRSDSICKTLSDDKTSMLHRMVSGV